MPSTLLCTERVPSGKTALMLQAAGSRRMTSFDVTNVYAVTVLAADSSILSLEAPVVAKMWSNHLTVPADASHGASPPSDCHAISFSGSSRCGLEPNGLVTLAIATGCIEGSKRTTPPS